MSGSMRHVRELSIDSLRLRTLPQLSSHPLHLLPVATHSLRFQPLLRFNDCCTTSHGTATSYTHTQCPINTAKRPETNLKVSPAPATSSYTYT